MANRGWRMNSGSRFPARQSAWAALVMLGGSIALGLSLAQSPPTPKVDLGRRIYRQGVLPSGQPVRATLQGDITIEGTQFNCLGCHRRSGFGSSEGAAFVPPVTGPSLFQAKEPRRADLFRKLYQEVQPKRARARIRDPRPRPAYTDETLAVALREGKDPTGRELDPLMPRYNLSDEDMGHLIAYLKTLSSTPSPGVTQSEIHFATVVTDGVDLEKRQAMLDVMSAYLRWKNADTQGLLQRRGSSPYHINDLIGALRLWVLHVWTLKGPPATWPDQLKSYYRAQPVFALIGGMSAGPWQTVHDFCEQIEIPCLFPNTDLPVASPTGAYSLYFSKGLIGEAEALARYLKEKNATRIIQVYRDAERTRAPARALQQALESYGMTGLQNQPIKPAGRPTPAFWKELLKDEQPSTLVLWLEDEDVSALASAPAAGIQQIHLSYTLLRDPALPLLKDLHGKILLTYPFALPQQESPHAFRGRAWMRSRGIRARHERIQLNTYFTLSLVDNSLMHLVENFSGDYLIESVEEETEGEPNPGVFPQLGLGPGQRFASKGCYIVKLSEKAKGGLEAVSDWIVP
jgi:hypothetical protein